MIKNSTSFLLLALAFIVISCNSKTSKSSNTNTNSNQYGSGYCPSGTTWNGSTCINSGTGQITCPTGMILSGSSCVCPSGTTWNGNTCVTGSTNGGTTGTTPVATCKDITSNGSLTCTDFDSTYSSGKFPSYRVVMAGRQNWGPGISPGTGVNQGSFPSVSQMAQVIATDTKLRVRFKIAPQPTTVATQTTCQGRVSGAGDSCTYSKLKFRVAAIPVSEYSGASSYYPNASWKDITVSGSSTEGISVDKCSEFIDLPHAPNVSHVIVVQDVKSDNACRVIGSFAKYCPNDELVRSQSCWALDMQVQTDTYSY